MEIHPRQALHEPKIKAQRELDTLACLPSKTGLMRPTGYTTFRTCRSDPDRLSPSWRQKSPRPIGCVICSDLHETRCDYKLDGLCRSRGGFPSEGQRARSSAVPVRRRTCNDSTAHAHVDKGTPSHVLDRGRNAHGALTDISRRHSVPGLGSFQTRCRHGRHPCSRCTRRNL